MRGVLLSNWDVLFWVGTWKWDNVGQGMVGGCKMAQKMGRPSWTFPKTMLTKGGG